MHGRVVEGLQPRITRQPLFDLVRGFPASGQQALAQYLRLHINEHCQKIRVAPPRFSQIGAGAIHQHRAARFQPLINVLRDPVVQPIGLPMHGKGTLRTHRFELLGSDALGCFALGFSRARDDAASNFYPGSSELLARGIDQGIFPLTRRSYQKYQAACR